MSFTPLVQGFTTDHDHGHTDLLFFLFFIQ